MSERSPKAFFISALLHGGVVALVLFYTYAAGQDKKDQPKTFVLVAGEGDNYAATEAPALGTPGGLKVEVPTITAAPVAPEPAPQPEPPSPAPVPEPSPVKPVEKKPEVKPVDKPPPDLLKVVQRTAARKEARLVAADKKKRVEEERKAKVAAAAEAKKMSKAEFDKQNAGKNKPPAGTGSSAKVSRIDAEGIRSGVVGGSTNNKTDGAGGKALSRAEQDLLEAYISLLIQRLRAAHEKPPGLSDLLQARVSFDISASGVISNATILRSSGSAEFDESVLAAFRRMKPLGAPPNGKSDTWTVMFKMHEEDN